MRTVPHRTHMGGDTRKTVNSSVRKQESRLSSLRADAGTCRDPCASPGGAVSQTGLQQTPKPETMETTRLHRREETRTHKKSLTKLEPVNKNVKIGKSTWKLQQVFSDQQGVNRATTCRRAHRHGLQTAPEKASPAGAPHYRHICE